MGSGLRGRHFLKEQDFTPAEWSDLLTLTGELKAARKAGAEVQRLAGANIALIFEKTSTRTLSLIHIFAGSLALSALLAALPLILLFLLLGVFKMKAWLAAIIGLLASIIVAIVGWGMPVAMAFSATAEGAFYGAFPIMWILLNAIWVYRCV